MKILYLPLIPGQVLQSEAVGDYQADTLFHGLRSVLGADVIDAVHLWHMYNTADQERLKKTWGKGFTVYSTLPEIEIDRDDIDNKVKNQYYDFIVIPIHHTLNGRWYEIASVVNGMINVYPQEKIVLIDGWDRPQISKPIARKVQYFKRELSDEFSDVAYPLSFSLPKEKIRSPLEREHDFSPMIPSSLPEHQATYIYTEEDPYYTQYQKSYFAFTSKKGREDVISESWDTMRHYEILANGCVPFFTNIERCPVNTLFKFPKDLCVRAKKLKGVYPGTKQPYNPEVDTYIGTCKEILEPENRGHINFDEFDMDEYNELNQEFIEYTKNNLTTESMAQYFLDKIQENAKNR